MSTDNALVIYDINKIEFKLIEDPFSSDHTLNKKNYTDLCIRLVTGNSHTLITLADCFSQKHPIKFEGLDKLEEFRNIHSKKLDPEVDNPVDTGILN
jgi:hypothetical protein